MRRGDAAIGCKETNITPVKTTLLSGLRGWLARRRFPTLLVLAAVLLVGDSLLPDPIPFADEVLLMIVTAALAAWRKKPDVVDEPSVRDGR